MGATFNLKHTINQMLYFRPHNRYGKYSNLYLAGGGTHPGSGLPTIYESGRISSNLVCEQFGLRFPKVDLASFAIGLEEGVPPTLKERELQPV